MRTRWRTEFRQRLLIRQRLSHQLAIVQHYMVSGTGQITHLELFDIAFQQCLFGVYAHKFPKYFNRLHA